MMGQFRKYQVVGIACLLVGKLVFAGEHARFVPLETAGAGSLIIPYPAAVAMDGVTSLRRVNARLRFDQYFDALNLSPKTNGVERYGPGLGRIKSNFLPTPASGVPSIDSASHDDFASQDDDEWHFSASPQLGANHEHEKSVTFSLKRGF